MIGVVAACACSIALQEEEVEMPSALSNVREWFVVGKERVNQSITQADSERGGGWAGWQLNKCEDIREGKPPLIYNSERRIIWALRETFSWRNPIERKGSSGIIGRGEKERETMESSSLFWGVENVSTTPLCSSSQYSLFRGRLQQVKRERERERKRSTSNKSGVTPMNERRWFWQTSGGTYRK
jgi:hypothetical protein